MNKLMQTAEKRTNAEKHGVFDIKVLESSHLSFYLSVHQIHWVVTQIGSFDHWLLLAADAKLGILSTISVFKPNVKIAISVMGRSFLMSRFYTFIQMCMFSFKFFLNPFLKITSCSVLPTEVSPNHGLNNTKSVAQS